MNALASQITPHIQDATQVELFALRDIIDAMITGGLAYATNGPKAVRHRSGRLIYRHDAARTLAFHRSFETFPGTSPTLAAAARRIAADLEGAIRLSFPEEA